MQTITLNIEGMTCGGCVKSVTSILEGVNGVDKAEVSLETRTRRGIRPRPNQPRRADRSGGRRRL